MYPLFGEKSYLHLQVRRICHKEKNVRIEGIGDRDNESEVTLQTFYGHVLVSNLEWFSWFPLVALGNCWGSISIGARPLPSKPVTIHYSSVVPLCDAADSRYWKPH
jgi:hypothetical protein